MSGNVWEWCNDWDTDYSSAIQIDPVGPVTGTARIRRGSSWVGGVYYLRCAYRYDNEPVFRTTDVGFRTVLPIR